MRLTNCSKLSIFDFSTMKCLDCQYDLQAITGNVCPECGCDFDKSDPTTFETRQRVSVGQKFDRAAYLFFVLMSGSSVFHVLSGYAALVAARIALGHWPNRVGKVDPKSINWFVSVLHTAWLFSGLLAGLLLSLAVPLVLVAIVRLAVTQEYDTARKRRIKWTILTATLMIAVGLVLHLNHDPAEITAWMID